MSHATYMNEPSCVNAFDIRQMYSRVNESFDKTLTQNRNTLSHTPHMSHVNIRHMHSRVNESCHICEWVMPHI